MRPLPRRYATRDPLAQGASALQRCDDARFCRFLVAINRALRVDLAKDEAFDLASDLIDGRSVARAYRHPVGFGEGLRFRYAYGVSPKDFMNAHFAPGSSILSACMR